jgi:hypothetical protein
MIRERRMENTMEPWINKTTTKFTTLSNAKNFINRCVKPGKWSIIMGDDMKYWIVTNREAARLVKLGYEMIDILRS